MSLCNNWSIGKIWKPRAATQAIAGKLADLGSISTLGKSRPSPPGPAIPGKDPAIGTNPIIKTFYDNGYSNAPNHNYYWVESPPKQLKEKVIKSYSRIAIKVYKVKDLDQSVTSGTTPLKYHKIELQNPILINALKEIVEAEGVFLEATEPAVFQEPFRPLYFSYDKIVALQKATEEGTVLYQHLLLLLQVMQDVFGGFTLRLKNLWASGLISYRLAWTYFPKNSIVYSPGRDFERAYRVVNTEYRLASGQCLLIMCEEISFDGDSFTTRMVTLEIPIFKGNLPVTSLPHYPLSFHEDQEGVRERLIARGKRVLDYQQLTYCDYSGIGLGKKQPSSERYNVSGRIVLDIYGYLKANGNLKRAGTNVPVLEAKCDEDYDQAINARTNQLKYSAINAGYNLGSAGQVGYIQRITDEEQQRNKARLLRKEEDLVIISPLLVGFSLREKLWMDFNVDEVKPVTWNDEAYDHLVYPEEQKNLLLTFVQNHKLTRESTDDVIVGKGQGLIVLLSGPPGTGKTLTAEAVADKTRRPLYYLQAEELGTNAATLGTKLKETFELAAEWDSIILLDEADVFMAPRSPKDIARNELISVFLRELEYFRGIVFLTTNLYESVGPAFRSRVNIHMLFSQLSAVSRLTLWRKFLGRLPSGSSGVKNMLQHLTNDDLLELSRWELNGREIKNTVKTVKTWCDCKDYEINLSRLESGIKVTSPQATKVAAK